ncbi:pyridoxamine 5'-phosphate oxidase family protein [Janthinobacterium sp. SUN033]|uniref:pyridoxamine 5'-phosphate oxidase family protein n=1 Tax=Janthinobacterium sp. SUN033 TaxID=3002439 RepID=UPI00339D4B42
MPIIVRPASSTNGTSTMTATALPPSPRTRVRRVAELASYEQTTLHAILDAAYLCHIAFRDDKGSHCIPTACWRIGGHLYIHGSNGSRMLKQLLLDGGACVTVSHLDGLVLARSAFNHTMNYRSAMVYGQFEKVSDIGQQHAAMDALMEKLAPGRLTQVRGGSTKEYAATTVLRIALDECAVKQRTGGPLDDAGDMAHAVWTGELPFTHGRGAAIADALNTCDIPAYAAAWGTESA